MLFLWLITLNSVPIASSICLNKHRNLKRLHQRISHTGRPWLVFIKIMEGQRMEVCAGSIITQDFVLTAAHCICHAINCTLGLGHRKNIGDKLFVEAGISDRRLGFLYPNRTYSVEEVHVHPSYNISAMYSPHDLAILKLRSSIHLSRSLSAPICIKSIKSRQKLKHMSVAGWGMAADPACLTKNASPQPFHRCQHKGQTYSNCTKVPNPSYESLACQEYFHQRQSNVRLNHGQQFHSITILRQSNGTVDLCWEDRTAYEITQTNHSLLLSGKHGWCEVKSASKMSDWGFCRASCNGNRNSAKSKPREVSGLHELSASFCQSSNNELLNFDPKYDICAAKLTKRTISASHFHVLKVGSKMILKKIDSIGAVNITSSFLGGADACTGDSGAPLWKWTSDRVAVQVGLVSRGVGCGRYNEPGIYVRLAPYISWILRIVRSKQ